MVCGYGPLLHIFFIFDPLPDDKILDGCNLKQYADDNSKFDENRRKFSKRVENTVGKGEIARYEQCLLFPQCLQKACFLGSSKKVSLCVNGLTDRVLNEHTPIFSEHLQSYQIVKPAMLQLHSLEEKCLQKDLNDQPT